MHEGDITCLAADLFTPTIALVAVKYGEKGRPARNSNPDAVCAVLAHGQGATEKRLQFTFTFLRKFFVSHRSMASTYSGIFICVFLLTSAQVVEAALSTTFILSNHSLEQLDRLGHKVVQMVEVLDDFDVA